MSILATMLVLALAGAVAWVIGAPLARIGGILLAASAAVAVATSGVSAARIGLIAAGAALWLAGHFLTAYKSRTWRSRFAAAIVARTPLRYIDPIVGRDHRTARRAARTARTVQEQTAPAPVDHFAEWERELTAPAPAVKRAPIARPRPSRGSIYGKRVAKAASKIAVRTLPGARAARSAWRFLR